MEKVTQVTDKSLKEKAIKFQGKDYVLVADRIKYFNETYPKGSIRTEIRKDEGNTIQIQAVVIPDIGETNRVFIGHAEEIRGVGFVNKTSAVENAETSAIGRALAMMGIGVIDSVASMDELNIAKGKEVKLAQINTEVKVDKPTQDFDI
jgi:hypothetical protein